MKYRLLKPFTLILLLTALAAAQNVASFEKRITVKKLPNGLTILICERPEAPVFSFFTMVDAGSAQDRIGEVTADRLDHVEHLVMPVDDRAVDLLGDLDITESVKSELGGKSLLPCAFQNVDVCGIGIPEIFGIDRAIRIRNFSKT